APHRLAVDGRVHGSGPVKTEATACGGALTTRPLDGFLVNLAAIALSIVNFLPTITMTMQQPRPPLHECDPRDDVLLNVVCHKQDFVACCVDYDLCAKCYAASRHLQLPISLPQVSEL
ncbi:hypothetical protein As57867_021065, partial [Aphanomyces stellatus]